MNPKKTLTHEAASAMGKRGGLARSESKRASGAQNLIKARQRYAEIVEAGRRALEAKANAVQTQTTNSTEP